MGEITLEDIEFYKLLRSSVCDDFWERDERGNRVRLIEGWVAAQEKYDRIVNAANISKHFDFQCVRP